MQAPSDIDFALLREVFNESPNLTRIEELLQVGANANVVSTGISGTGRALDTPLRIAIEQEKAAVIVLLLHYGATIDIHAKEITLADLNEYNIFAPPRQPDIVIARMNAEIGPASEKAKAIYKILLEAGQVAAAPQRRPNQLSP